MSILIREVVDTDAPFERYRQEIEELGKWLTEKENEAEAPEDHLPSRM